jgi:methionine-gamma-lyase
MKHPQAFATQLVHGSLAPCPHTGAIVPPLYQTSTFLFEHAEQGAKRFAGEEEGYIYTRLGNPTLQQWEAKMAELEGAEAGVAFSSGMAAISAVLIGLLGSGDHILCSDAVYGCTYGLLNMLEEKFQIQTSYTDTSSPEKVAAAFRSNTRVVYLETPINPTMKVADINSISRLAHQQGAVVVVDNTFATPYLQQPIRLGADIVFHSATKYIGGHGDVIAGVVLGSQEQMDILRMTSLKDIGGVLSPFDAWLLLRGLKTLAVRMDRHVENARVVARFLHEHPAVSEVFYPGLAHHPQRALVEKQMRAPGGMITFRVKGGQEAAFRMLNRVQLCNLTVSLGEVTTLIQHPATMTHSSIPEPLRRQMGITEDMIRLSVGIEDVRDIISDLEQALNELK